MTDRVSREPSPTSRAAIVCTCGWTGEDWEAGRAHLDEARGLGYTNEHTVSDPRALADESVQGAPDRLAQAVEAILDAMPSMLGWRQAIGYRRWIAEELPGALAAARDLLRSPADEPSEGAWEARFMDEQAARRVIEIERDGWIRLFNRLEAAVSRHIVAKAWTDDTDDALHTAHAKVLRAAAEGREARG